MPFDWESVRDVWERDNRPGFAWLCREQGITQSRQAVQKRASREGWTKHEAASATEKQKAKPKDSNRKRATARKGEKVIAPQAKNGVESENDESSIVQSLVENDALTDREKVFVAEYLKDFNAFRAAKAAGYAGERPNAYRALGKPNVQAAIQQGVSERINKVGIDGDRLMAFWSSVLTVDYNEFQQVRRVPCPYCWSATGEAQITLDKYLSRQEDHHKQRMKALADGNNIGEYPPCSEFEFIDESKCPNPQCHVCHGIGVERLFQPDTRHLSPEVKPIYMGAKISTGGRPIVEAFSKEAASKYLAQALGVFRDKEDEKEIVAAVSAEELSRLYDERMKLARERQAAVDRERGLK